jgi:response regulator RpfG family c-di-GMP phosphodiesterase
MKNQRPVQQWKFLFVNAGKEDTQFLTKDLPVEILHAEGWESAEHELNRQVVHGMFVDITEAKMGNLSKIKQLHDTAIVMLTSVSELPDAIEHVKRGDAHGFVIKGISDSDSVMRLMQFASKTSLGS